MIERRSFQTDSASSNLAEFDKIFIGRVHALIRLGYDRLTPSVYGTLHETVITGDLAREIAGVLEEATEQWMPFFRIYDDPPVNLADQRKKSTTPGKGRARKRVDIKLDSSQTSPYTCFHFEAKRLGKNHSASNYLSNEGLGCFLSGSYAAEETRAGMLGYIQQDDEIAWASHISNCIAKDLAKFRIANGGDWKSCPLIEELPHTYATCHDREMNLGSVLVYHTLLRFY